MASRICGAKYEETKGLGTAQIASLIRTDIKAALSDGRLPKGTKVIVRIKRYSGGSSITCQIIEWPGMSANPARAWYATKVGIPYDHPSIHHMDWSEVHPDPVAAVQLLGLIMDAYNFDGSDSQSDYFDVRFYGHAVHCLPESKIKADQAAAMMQARAEFESE